MMTPGLNNYFHTLVHTQRGIISLNDAVPGDMVYEYKTGKMLPIRDVVKTKSVDIWEVKYTDKRKSILCEDDAIYVGDDKIVPLYDAIRNPSIYGRIKPYALEFNPSKIKVPLDPDPYVAGALFCYGDFNDEYLNLQLDVTACNNILAHKYKLNYGFKLENNKVYFSYDSTPETEIITWKEFFPNYDFYAKTGKITSPPFPNEYKYASISDRKQFIRGMFDVGYMKRYSPDNPAIMHWDEERLKHIQDVLYSLGILSRIDFIPWNRDEDGFLHKISYGRIYMLEILGTHEGYPGFFYDIDKIERMIQVDNSIMKLETPFELRIESIGRIYEGYSITKGFMSNIILDKPHTIYLDSNYLPRVSL